MSHVGFTKPCACPATFGLFSSSHSEAPLEKVYSILPFDFDRHDFVMESQDKSIVNQPQPEPSLSQILLNLQALGSDMRSMSTEMRSISTRLEVVEGRQEEESETSTPASPGPARRAPTVLAHSTPKESGHSSTLSWAERVEQEETSNPEEGSMEVEEAGEELDAEGSKLFAIVDEAEAIIRPACLSPLRNFARRQLVQRFGKPGIACTSAPYLDKVLRSRLPAPVRARDNELAKIQAMSLDGMIPLCRVLNDALRGEINIPGGVMEAIQTSIRLLGSTTAHVNRLRRTSVLQSLNPGIVEMAEEDSIFVDAGTRLFGEGFSEKAKKRDDELKALDRINKRQSQPTSSGFHRPRTQPGKQRFNHSNGSGRGKPRFQPYRQHPSSRKDKQ